MNNNPSALSAIDRLARLASILPEESVEELIDFAEFLREKQWRREHQAAGLENFARAYGDDEPEYTLADIRPDRTTHE